MAAGGVDPPRGAAHVLEGQTEVFEIVGAEVLPGDGLLRPVQTSADPAGARAAERTVAVVDEHWKGSVDSRDIGADQRRRLLVDAALTSIGVALLKMRKRSSRGDRVHLVIAMVVE